MFDIGFSELLVIGVLGLLVLGPEKLPKAARTLGLLFGRARRTVNNFQDELERQVRAEELREKLKDPYATFMGDDERARKEAEEASTSASPVATPSAPATEPAHASSAPGNATLNSTATPEAVTTAAVSQPRPQDTPSAS